MGCITLFPKFSPLPNGVAHAQPPWTASTYRPEPSRISRAAGESGLAGLQYQLSGDAVPYGLPLSSQIIALREYVLGYTYISMTRFLMAGKLRSTFSRLNTQMKGS